MKDLISSKSKKKLKIAGQKSCSHYRPGFKLEISKKLNSSGLLFLFASYTVAVVLLTAYYVRNGSQMAPSYSNAKLKNDIVSELKKEISLQKERESREAIELAKLKESILKEVGDLHIKYFDIIAKQEEKKRPKILLRNPASLNSVDKEPSEGRALSYNYKNRKILRQKQILEVKRLKESLAAQKEAFFKSLDLTTPSDKQKWKNFQDQQQMEITALEAEHNQQWKNFRNEKFIIVQNF
ncbi:MAG: hypothetical protein WEB87_03600 [Bacteriovoracaceae bacterium]